MPRPEREIEYQRTYWRFIGMIMALLSPLALNAFYWISAQVKPYTRAHMSFVLLASGIWIAVSIFMTMRQFSIKWMLLAALMIGVVSMLPVAIDFSRMYPH